MVRREWLRALLALAAIALLLAHAIVPSHFKVDTVTLGLLFFLVVLVVLPQIEELDFFGNKIRLARKVDETSQIADKVVDEARRADPDVPVDLRPPRAAQELASVDPIAAVVSNRARVVEAIVDLYRVVYDGDPADVDDAIARLEADGFLGRGLAPLARNLLNLSRGTMHGAVLSPEQARIVADSATKFMSSLGRIASLNFEQWVEQALRLYRDAIVERRPPDVAIDRRAPDFVVQTDERRFIVEAYLPARDLPYRLLKRRITDRQRFMQPIGAAGLLVVVPNGVRAPVIEMSLPPRVAVMKLADVDKAARDNTLFDQSRFGGIDRHPE